ncbi:GNAT family N-acetyltransferase [Catenuloplanes indicus]|uniref:Ribosomal protein S18 acetylase RimI-like enzyme n=1 Tax=Catenuloplanes indicus TaxID=137267 RepID=A0AAE4B3I0_9ACTN|nr:GNAT family N-acetyltransferase [Catenuloplanes indicus]MDQ0370143.1 ribosomal protein S18 acetylase RimI-like enzyme [Catenuloplanes indicus]
MADIVVRDAEPGDAVVVAELIEEIERYYGAASVQPIEERVAQVRSALFGVPPLAWLLLAVDGEEVVGLAAYSFLWPAAGSTHSLFLKELYVRPSRRRRGVGASLMGRVRDIAEARPGCGRVEWQADRDNPVAQAFYRGLGFEESAGKINYRITLGS